jgi:hypothetical protein
MSDNSESVAGGWEGGKGTSESLFVKTDEK